MVFRWGEKSYGSDYCQKMMVPVRKVMGPSASGLLWIVFVFDG